MMQRYRNEFKHLINYHDYTLIRSKLQSLLVSIEKRVSRTQSAVGREPVAGGDSITRPSHSSEVGSIQCASSTTIRIGTRAAKPSR